MKVLFAPKIFSLTGAFFLFVLLLQSTSLQAQQANVCLTKECLTPVPSASPSAMPSASGSGAPYLLSTSPSTSTTVLKFPATPDANLLNEVNLFLKASPIIASPAQLEQLADSTRLLLAFFKLCLTEATQPSLAARESTFRTVVSDAYVMTSRNSGKFYQAPFRIGVDQALLEFFKKSYGGSCPYLTTDPAMLAPAASPPLPSVTVKKAPKS